MFKQNFRTGGAIAASALAALLFASPAAAEEYTVIGQREAEWQPHSTVVMVPAGDLDLRTSEGEGLLKSRVRDAASRACDDALGKAAHPLDVFNCRVSAIRGAHRQVDHLVELARANSTVGYPVLASAITLRIAQ